MGIKITAARWWAKFVQFGTQRWAMRPHETQETLFWELIRQGKETQFGRDHHFDLIRDYVDFKHMVPVRDYEGLRGYIEAIKKGGRDVLWPGKPIYFCETSGTTSGKKYIPITKASLPNHIRSARNALLAYVADTGSARFLNGKMMFIQGSPELESVQGILTGRLSGIAAHHVPGYLLKNRLPSMEVNCMEDWEEKVEAIVTETIDENMTVIAGIPAWVQMYFERLQARANGKTMKEIFPNLELLVMGGVHFGPYAQRFAQLLGGPVNRIELYPASEGFLAYQDVQDESGLLLLLNEGIFYEFIPADEYFSDHPQRLRLDAVELGVNYALVLSNNAGLWGYSIGDTIKFVSKNPYRIVVTGRIKHFISAFGEHVIAEEVEGAMQEALEGSGTEINEFTVAPQVIPAVGALPYHEWYIEFEQVPHDIEAFGLKLDQALQSRNAYYADLVQGKIIRPLLIRQVKKNGFTAFMKARGKLGGQNKIPRLSNERVIAEELEGFLL